MTQAARQLDLLETPPAPSKPKIVRVPDIRFAPPSAPGSKSSEDAADLISPFRRESWTKIIVALARLAPDRCLSREEISQRTEIKETTCCGRIWELVNLPIEMAGTEERMCVEAVEDACVSSSHVTVTGYRLTAAGRELFNRNGDGR